MKSLSVKLGVILIGLALFPYAEVWGADWKFIGGSVLQAGSQLKGETNICYCDPASVEYLSNGNIRVWIKAISPSEHNNKIIEKKEVIEKAAQKVVDKYIPPYVLLHPETTFNDYVNIIGWEEAANDAEIKPRARVFYEVNCRDKMIRTLSVTTYNDAGVASRSKGDGWDYISPETNAETLRKILCKDRK
jgi:hypothetical protein